MGDLIGGLFVIATFLCSVAGWFTHVIFCLQVKAYVLLIAGAFVFPVGIIHGIGLLDRDWETIT